MDYDKQQLVLHSPFNIDTHKETFVNYLEVVMSPEGVVEYAVPSHQEKLISVLQKCKGWSREEVYLHCPEDYYFDFMKWLCECTGYIAIWDNYFYGTANIQQQESLNILKANNLYKGEI